MYFVWSCRQTFQERMKVKELLTIQLDDRCNIFHTIVLVFIISHIQLYYISKDTEGKDILKMNFEI